MSIQFSVETDQKLVKLRSEAPELISDFHELVKESILIADEARSLPIGNDVAVIARAKELLPVLKSGNAALEAKRKEVKEVHLRATQIIDGAARVIREDFFAPLIDHVSQVKDFEKNRLAAEAKAKLEHRLSQIATITDAQYPNEAASASDADFESLITRLQAEKEQAAALAKAEAELAEQKRLADEAESKRIREENERLKSELAKQAEVDRANAEKIEAERKEKLALETAEKAKAEAAALAPDKEKLRAFIAQLETIERPQLSEAKTKDALIEFEQSFKRAIAILQTASR